MKTIILGADHAGFDLKEKLKKSLDRQGLVVMDLSPEKQEGDDYPLIGKQVAMRVKKSGHPGVIVCGSGEGVAIAANRQKGIRAILGSSVKQVTKLREHEDINILTLSGWWTKPVEAMRLIQAFLSTKASNAARHRRRQKQLDA